MSTTMNNMDKENAKKINELIQVNLDSHDGFNKAADDVDDPRYASLFRELGQTRQRHAQELQQALQAHSDVEPETEGSALAGMHRWWIGLRDKLTGDSAYDVLAEAERGEDHIKAKYEDILPKVAGTPINDVLLSQYAAVKAGHDKVRDLRDAEKARKD